jgi:hypothetical protein
MEVVTVWDRVQRVLVTNTLNWSDVQYICGRDFNIAPDTFERLARATPAKQRVAEDLTIVFSRGWIIVDAWDGYGVQTLEYITFPKHHRVTSDISTLYGEVVFGAEETLAEINNFAGNNPATNTDKPA